MEAQVDHICAASHVMAQKAWTRNQVVGQVLDVYRRNGSALAVSLGR
jgi:hypothetical protein